MTTLVSMLSTLGVVGSIIWVWNLVHLARHRDRVVFLRDCPAEPPAGGWPPLAVVFAARDEEESVEQATRSMLAQDYPGLEVIAVDDRSTDATGAILDAIGLEDGRLRVVHVEELPPGGSARRTRSIGRRRRPTPDGSCSPTLTSSSSPSRSGRRWRSRSRIAWTTSRPSRTSWRSRPGNGSSWPSSG